MFVAPITISSNPLFELNLFPPFNVLVVLFNVSMLDPKGMSPVYPLVSTLKHLFLPYYVLGPLFLVPTSEHPNPVPSYVQSPGVTIWVNPRSVPMAHPH